MNNFLKQLQAEAVAEGVDISGELAALDTVPAGAYMNGDARVWVGAVIVYTLSVAKSRASEAPSWVTHVRETQWHRLTVHAVKGIADLLASAAPCELSDADLSEVQTFDRAFLSTPNRPRRKQKQKGGA